MVVVLEHLTPFVLQVRTKTSIAVLLKEAYSENEKYQLDQESDLCLTVAAERATVAEEKQLNQLEQRSKEMKMNGTGR